jgi:hypothetical protein
MAARPSHRQQGFGFEDVNWLPLPKTNGNTGGAGPEPEPEPEPEPKPSKQWKPAKPSEPEQLE